MNTDQFLSLIRTILKVASGILVAHGLQNTATVINSPDVIGAILLVAGCLWSHFTHAAPASAGGSSSSSSASTVSALLLVGALALTATFSTGCHTPNLAPGGAYAPASITTNTDGSVSTNATAAPQVDLFVLDAAYKTAYDAVDGVLAYEYNNRAAVAAISPQIKIDLDKIRPVAWQVNQNWAVARQAYMLNPTPAGLTTLQTILAKIQQLVPVATAIYANITATNH